MRTPSDRTAPLAGVPFPAKDVNVHVAGFPTTWACRFFAGAPAQAADSLLVSRWRCGRTRRPRPHQHTGVRHRVRVRTRALRPHRQPLGPEPHARRVERRRGGGGGLRDGADGARHRLRRVDPGAGGLLRRLRTSSLRAASSPSDRSTARWWAGSTATTRSRGRCATAPRCSTPPPARRSALRHPGPRPPARSWTLSISPSVRCGSASRRSLRAERPPAAEIARKVEATSSLLTDLGHSVRPWAWPISDDACDGCGRVLDRRARGGDRRPRRGARARAARRRARSRWSPGAWPRRRRLDSIRVMRARAMIRDWQIRMAGAMTGFDVLLTPVTAEPPLETGLLRACFETDLDARKPAVLAVRALHGDVQRHRPAGDVGPPAPRCGRTADRNALRRPGGRGCNPAAPGPPARGGGALGAAPPAGPGLPEAPSSPRLSQVLREAAASPT